MNLPKGRISSLGQQFMPVTQLRGLESSDYPGRTVGEVTSGGASSRVATGQHHDMDQLHKDVAEQGITDPLYVGDNGHTLSNGHHRAQVAIEQGHMFVPTTNRFPEGAAWAPQTYRGGRKLAPTRTWEPLLQEHEAEHEASTMERANTALSQRMDFRQGTMFPDHGFTDRRTRGKS